ncbi:hypothetical protein FRC18_009176 [Serendipita sp. 400]|nr:hypothetical protein FRC18_009176 [Serendipita sp. 400]
MISSRDISASSSAQFRARSNVVGSNRRLYSPMSESTRREHSLTVSTDPRFGLQPGGHLPAPQSVFTRVRMLIIVAFGLYCTIKFTLDVVLRGLGPSPPRKEDQSVVSPLDALPQSFRLSRLADLHNPHDFQPFFVYPRFIDPLALNITACVCITPLELDQVVTAANGWPGKKIR